MFGHLAQGVEFSIDGYPQPKPKLYQVTVGTIAFRVFELRGRMSHGLDEPIPGEVISEISAHDGVGRLWTSLERFKAHDGPLMPHFAYGALSKEKYAKAHLLHLENHLEEVKAR